MKVNCKDCGLEVSLKTQSHCWTDKFTPDHEGLCCDCFDETFGMPESSRNKPRPKKD